MLGDVVIKPFGLGFPLHSLVFKWTKFISDAIKYFIPGVDNVVRVIENKRRIPRRFFRSNKLFFVYVLDVTVGDCCMCDCALYDWFVFPGDNGR